MMIEIKPIKDMKDFKKTSEIQKSAWGFSDRDIEPHQLMTRVQKYGGLVQGLYLNGELAGFTYAILAMWKGKYFIYSHMTGVRKEDQKKGYGYLLKKAQREEVLNMGYNVIRWNFDPLESMNAFFNIHRLGIVSVEYERDIYGTGESGLHKGLSTDRLIATWHLNSDRVIDKMNGKDLPIIEQVLENEPDDFTQKTAYIEIPKDIRSLKKTDIDKAIQWRMKTRRLFESAFQNGYVATDIVFSNDKKRIFYKLYNLKMDKK